MVEKIKEKRPVSQKAKEKIQSAPKELLRRGLLDGTEKIYGQLRDTAQGGQREDTAADRVQGTTERGARLAVDRPAAKVRLSALGQAMMKSSPWRCPR